MSTNRGGIIGVDVGGTFTDLVVIDGKTGHIRIAKTPTTLENQAFGVLTALDDAQVKLPDINLIVHGTTTTTNAVLERKLSRTGLITTGGFRDVLELGRRTRPQAYGMTGQFVPVSSCHPSTADAVVRVAANPRGEAVQHGKATGRCSCCGRELTDPISIEMGIGPICANNWGL